MSNYYDNTVSCPKCGHSPIACLDYWNHWVYECTAEDCGFSTRDYSELVKKEKEG